MKLIMGLGNPGSRYKNTRHNVGYRVVELLAAELDAKFDTKKHNSLWTETTVGGEKVVIAKPITYMNLSGSAVSALSGAKGAALDDLLIICDDTNLKLGSLKIKAKGSSGGHNGMDSVIESLGSDEFARLRVGIGPKPPAGTLTDYVLGRFGESEERILSRSIDAAAAAAKRWITCGIERAMNQFNVK